MNRLFQLSDKRLLLTRYLVNLVGLVEIISLPILFSPDFYSQVELSRQLFLLAPLFILGGHSGYLLCFYKENRNLQSSLVVTSSLIGLVVASFVASFVPGFFPAIAAFLVILVTSLEKILVTKGKLFAASVYKKLSL